jgi:hypothetical protein
LGETTRGGSPVGELVLASANGADAPRYLLAAPSAVFRGSSLTDFLARVAPFGCPPPPSLIRAYSLPDAMHPSILLREHEDAPDDVGDAYRRFLARSRLHWLAALNETGPGLCPALAWRAGPDRRFLAAEEWPGAPRDVGIGDACVADTYLGRALLMLADADLAASWPTMMSLGSVTKARKMTGREFPVWVDLSAHQPALLASRVLARAERLLS